MAHDDHFETIEIANSWVHDGMFLPDGTLRWEGKPDIGVLRSAVYSIFLYGQLKISAAAGIEHLDLQMYFIRFIHALLSLLPVIYGYRYLKEETDDRTATMGGMLLAAHFLMPFLAVRNLVEMVSADFLLPSLYYAHRSVKSESDSDAILAGVFAGLAFIIRMQVIMAAAVVPVAMVFGYRDWRRGIVFSLALLVLIGAQGVIDIYTHGKFLGSLTNYIAGNMGAPPTMPEPWYNYILLVFGVMIPPLAFIFVGSIFLKKVIKEHLILWLPTIAFLIGHSVITNKQERFIIPIFPALLVLGSLGLHYLAKSQGWYTRQKLLRFFCWAIFLIANVAALVPFTFDYGHRGAVDPLVFLSRQDDAKSVLFDCSERRMFIPFSYWKYDRTKAVTVYSQDELMADLKNGKLSAVNPPDYVVVFSDTALDSHIGMLQSLGDYKLVHHSEPSLMDIILNKMNPKYNHRNESWVLKREGVYSLQPLTGAVPSL
jgi:hypothetical protein